MAHVFETAPTGRAKCRGCGKAIARGEVRFGERLPNPYADGEMTLWFHPECAALKRPEPFLEALAQGESPIEDGERLAELARSGLTHRRLPRIDGAQRSPNARARCRCCREPIVKGSWRISLVFFQDGRFESSGHVHATCSLEYFGTTDVVGRSGYFSALSEEEFSELGRALGRP